MRVVLDGSVGHDTVLAKRLGHVEGDKHVCLDAGETQDNEVHADRVDSLLAGLADVCATVGPRGVLNKGGIETAMIRQRCEKTPDSNERTHRHSRCL